MISARQVVDAIIFALRIGCQWKVLPKKIFGSDSAVHKRLLECEAAGEFDAVCKPFLLRPP